MAYFVADAVTNSDTRPIVVQDIRPDKVSSGWTFRRAVKVDYPQGVAVDLATSTEPGVDPPFHMWPNEPVKAVTLAGGETLYPVMLEFVVDAKTSAPLTASGVRVTYTLDGKEFVEVLGEQFEAGVPRDSS